MDRVVKVAFDTFAFLDHGFEELNVMLQPYGYIWSTVYNYGHPSIGWKPLNCNGCKEDLQAEKWSGSGFELLYNERWIGWIFFSWIVGD